MSTTIIKTITQPQQQHHDTEQATTNINMPHPVPSRDLELVVGTVAESDWDDAASLAKELHAWRRDRVRAASRPQPPAAPLRTPEAPGPAATRGQRGRSLLFGSEISFNFDLDALAPEESEDELDRAFPGVNGGGASGGFAFDSFESFVGISADSGGGSSWGGAAAASEQQRWRPGTGVTVDDQASSSSLGGEEEKKHPVRDVGAAAAGAGAVRAPPASGTASSEKAGAAGAAAAAETFDAGWLYSRCKVRACFRPYYFGDAVLVPSPPPPLFSRNKFNGGVGGKDDYTSSREQNYLTGSTFAVLSSRFFEPSRGPTTFPPSLVRAGRAAGEARRDVASSLLRLQGGCVSW